MNVTLMVGQVLCLHFQIHRAHTSMGVCKAPILLQALIAWQLEGKAFGRTGPHMLSTLYVLSCEKDEHDACSTLNFNNLEIFSPFFPSKVASLILFYNFKVIIMISLILKKNMFCKEFHLE